MERGTWIRRPGDGLLAMYGDREVAGWFEVGMSF
jgi:hypothetical protein